ncbi:hypothetical protein K431DRAFT_287413 [Polychaeton citri CBS 116435]|uniref:Alpha-acetolactate decarboxylase n=1 Tax=Polychaeton citri CBS 116435 TaxID=1314669 RepID=A0A9P4UN66_9PEZI|nr:hypothetical protein K431DRAFT_287413 [Polychaeton citri CBS 116435]
MPASIPNDIYQYSLLSAFQAGLKTGGPPVAFLTNHGTHGIGICEDEAAHLIQVDGRSYILSPDGKASPASDHTPLPFVMVNVFQPTCSVHVPDGTTLSGLRYVFEAKGLTSSGKNTPMPFSVRGTFKRIHLGLENELEGVRGTIFGYSIPVWQAELSGTGIQCCFITDDLKSGGRVMDFEIGNEAVVDWAKCGRFHLGFPQEEQYETLTM